MGVHGNISADRFPRQGDNLGREADVVFHYDTRHTVKAVCVRDDREEPFETIFCLADDRHVRSVECQFSFLPRDRA